MLLSLPPLIPCSEGVRLTQYPPSLPSLQSGVLVVLIGAPRGQWQFMRVSNPPFPLEVTLTYVFQIFARSPLLGFFKEVDSLIFLRLSWPVLLLLLLRARLSPSCPPREFTCK